MCLPPLPHSTDIAFMRYTVFFAFCSFIFEVFISFDHITVNNFLASFYRHNLSIQEQNIFMTRFLTFL